MTPEMRVPNPGENAYLVIGARDALLGLLGMVQGGIQQYPEAYVEEALREGVHQALERSGWEQQTALLKRALWEALCR